MDPISAAPLLTRRAFPKRSEVLQEIRLLYSLAFPILLNGVIIFGKSAISMFILGKLIGPSVLAGGSFSLSTANITGYAVISGLAAGTEAILTQAHGAENFSLMTQTLHRTFAILLATAIPISLLWFLAKPLFDALEKPELANIAFTYLILSIPSLFLQCFISPLKIYLTAKSVTKPLLFGSLLTLIFHAAINGLVYRLGYGYKGVPVAVALTDLVYLMFLLAYLFWTNDVSIRSFEFRECFTGWMPILRLAAPSCASVCLEWWYYEFMILGSGFLRNGEEALATMGILQQVTTLIYKFPWSLSLAVATRVGNELGANRPEKARLVSWVGLLCAFATSFIALTFTYVSRKACATAFTADKKIVSLATSLMPMVGWCELGNSPQTTICGVLRGCGKPKAGAVINMVSFYVIGGSVALCMVLFVKIGLLGMWVGLLVAQIACLFLLGLYLWKIDWENEADGAQERVGKGEVRTESEEACSII